jgi:hypothetical protein
MRPPPNHLQGFVDAKQPGWNLRHRFRPTPQARPTTSAPSRAGGCGRHRRGAGSARSEESPVVVTIQGLPQSLLPNRCAAWWLLSTKRLPPQSGSASRRRAVQSRATRLPTNTRSWSA